MFIFIYFHLSSFYMMLLHCFSLCFTNFWYCWVGFLSPFIKWLSYIKLFILCLQSSCISITSVSFFLLLLLVFLLNFFYVHCLFLFFPILFFFLCFSYTYLLSSSRPHVYNNFVLLFQGYLRANVLIHFLISVVQIISQTFI